jgi:uncharacterized protein (TIGR02646 family)
MIAVTRTAKPNSLEQNAATWTTAYQAAKAALAADPNSKDLKKEKDAAEKKYKQPDVQMALKTMFNDKCGFCERKRDYPHIEHFRPKTNYPELCFEWENLILACEVCNGSRYKGTKFPLDVNDEPLFINPYDDNPTQHIDFVFESDANSPYGFSAILRAKTVKGQTTIDEIGLNRINLIRERNQYLLPYYLYTALKAKEGDVEAQRILSIAGDSSFVFAAFTRALFAELPPQ